MWKYLWQKLCILFDFYSTYACITSTCLFLFSFFPLRKYDRSNSLIQLYNVYVARCIKRKYHCALCVYEDNRYYRLIFIWYRIKKEKKNVTVHILWNTQDYQGKQFENISSFPNVTLFNQEYECKCFSSTLPSVCVFFYVTFLSPRTKSLTVIHYRGCFRVG